MKYKALSGIQVDPRQNATDTVHVKAYAHSQVNTNLPSTLPKNKNKVTNTNVNTDMMALSYW